jgi:hypothetical protein
MDANPLKGGDSKVKIGMDADEAEEPDDPDWLLVGEDGLDLDR